MHIAYTIKGDYMFNILKSLSLEAKIIQYINNNYIEPEFNPMSGGLDDITVWLDIMDEKANVFLKNKMNDNGFNGNSLADLANIDRRSVYNILNGRRTGFKTALKIGFALKLNKNEMLHWIYITGNEFSKNDKFSLAMLYIITEEKFLHLNKQMLDHVLLRLGLEPFFYSDTLGVDLVEYEIDLIDERYGPLDEELKTIMREKIINIDDIQRLLKIFSNESVDSINSLAQFTSVLYY